MLILPLRPPSPLTTLTPDPVPPASPSPSPTATPMLSHSASSTPTPTLIPLQSKIAVIILKNGSPFKDGSVGTPLKLVVDLDTGRQSYSSERREVRISYLRNGDKKLYLDTTVPLQGGYTNCATVDKYCFEITLPWVLPPSGTLTVQYAGLAGIDLPTSFNQALNAWTPQPRVLKDQSDDNKGFQLHFVYVVPFDGVDNHRDSSGEISLWAKVGSTWLDKQVGDHFLIDTYKGVPDVTYLHSKYSTAVLQQRHNSNTTMSLQDQNKEAVSLLTNEYDPNISGDNRKDIVFYLEVPYIKETHGGAVQDSIICGYTFYNSRGVIVAAGAGANKDGQGCSSSKQGIPTQASNALHEVTHTFGVGHVSTPGDLMLPVVDGYPEINYDKNRNLYYGSSNAGNDVKTLRVWSKSNLDASYRWPCRIQAIPMVYLCGLTPQTLMIPYSACWNNTLSPMFLQVESGKNWSNVFGAQASQIKECAGTNTPYGYSVQLGAKSPSSHFYRFKRGNWTSPTFKIVYQY
jgi:hypothetical protein